MQLIEQQEYSAWYKSLGDKIYDWHELKPDNLDLKNLLKGVEVIGVYNNKLQNENNVLKRDLDKLKQELAITLNNLNKLL